MKKKSARTTKTASGSKRAPRKPAASSASSKATASSRKAGSLAKKAVSARKKNAVKKKTLAKPVKKGLFGPLKPAAPGMPDRLDLPFSYGVTKLVLLVRDTEWAYSYWDFAGETWQWVQDIFKQNPGASSKLRVHNLDSGSFYDIDIHLESKNWYIHLGLANTAFQAELGILTFQGHFYSIVKSNQVRTPRNAPSENIDPDWPALPNDELYGLMSGSSGRSGPNSNSEFVSLIAKKRSS